MNDHRTIGPTPERLPKRRKRSQTGPGYDSAFEIGSRTVDDPYEPGNKIAVPFNVRHDPLVRMLARQEIDEACYRAGEDFRACFEALGGSGARAVDTSKEPVDGGKGYQGITDRAMRAARKIRDAQLVLGYIRFRVIRGVVCDGLNGSLIAQQSAYSIDRKAVQVEVRKGLETLAILWNYLSDPKHVRIRADMVASMSDRPSWAHEEIEVNIRYADK